MVGLRKIVADWLAEPIDWDEHVWFPDDIGSMGAAKVFFCLLYTSPSPRD